MIGQGSGKGKGDRETSSFHSPNVSARKKMTAVVGKGLSARQRSPVSGVLHMQQNVGATAIRQYSNNIICIIKIEVNGDLLRDSEN